MTNEITRKLTVITFLGIPLQNLLFFFGCYQFSSSTPENDIKATVFFPKKTYLLDQARQICLKNIINIIELLIQQWNLKIHKNKI